MVQSNSHLRNRTLQSTPVRPSGIRGLLKKIAMGLPYAPMLLLKEMLMMVFGFLIVGGITYLVIYWMGTL